MGTVLELSEPLRAAMIETELVAGLNADGGGEIGTALRSIAADDLETQMILPDGAVNAVGSTPAEFLSMWRDWVSSYERFYMDRVAAPVVNGDAMVNTVRQRGYLAGSQAEVVAIGMAAWFFSGGKLRRIEFHLDRDRALRAIGLDPADPDGTMPA